MHSIVFQYVEMPNCRNLRRDRVVGGFRVHFIAALALVLLLGCARSGSAESPAAESIQPTFPAPPRLAVTPASWADMQQADDFETRKAAAIKAGDALLAKPPVLPEDYASWIFYYACPDDGATLRAIDLEHHECPTCKKVYTDDRTVASWRCYLHHGLEHGALKLAWAYQYSGDDKYAVGAKRIFMHLATEYETYPGRLDRWGHTGFLAPLGGRRYVQSLDEAVGMTRLAPAYDLVRTSAVFSDDERQAVEEKFFRETANTLLRFRHKHNHQTWYNAGMMNIANVLGDAELVRTVLTMDEGYYSQLDSKINADGLWAEGTMAYHSYALQAMLRLVDAARPLGLDIHQDDRFKAMILGPLKAAYPDGRFPAINDSDPGSVRMFNHAFQWAWEAYDEPMFAHALAGGNLKKLQSLLGEDAALQPAITDSYVLEDTGLAFLRMGEGADAACAIIDFGAHGIAHGHPDKLNLMLYANGREWIFDPGRSSYSHKEYKSYYTQTAAHNTFMLDGKSQTPDDGRLLWFASEDRYAAVGAVTTGAYDGVTLRRYLFLTPTMLVDISEAACESPRQIDWLLHLQASNVRPAGDADTRVDAAPDATMNDKPISLGDTDGLELFADMQPTQQAGGSWIAEAGPVKLGVHLTTDAGDWFAGKALGYGPTQRTPVLVHRMRGKRSTVVAVYDLTGDASAVTSVKHTLTSAGDIHRVTVLGAGGGVVVECSPTAGMLK